MKSTDSYSKSLKGVVKEIIGACISIGVTIEGKEPKDVLEEVDQGQYDKAMSP
jgi:large subunit ribosomal protein L11